VKLIGRLLALIGLLWAHAALATPALDGTTAFTTCGSGSTLVLPPLTTTQFHDAIIVSAVVGFGNAWVYSISDTAGLTWQRRAQLQSDSVGLDHDEEWFAPAAGPLNNDQITITFTVPVGAGCFKGLAYAVSGAQWPWPFDPLWNQAKTVLDATTLTYTTLGTDDLLVANYTFNSCSGDPTPGVGWSYIQNAGFFSNKLYQQKTVAGAQINLNSPFGGSCGTLQMGIGEAFAASDGLGSLVGNPKDIQYIILQTGMGMSKDNLYVIVEPGISMSKDTLYAITLPTAAPAAGGAAVLPHIFPP